MSAFVTVSRFNAPENEGRQAEPFDQATGKTKSKQTRTLASADDTRRRLRLCRCGRFPPSFMHMILEQSFMALPYGKMVHSLFGNGHRSWSTEPLTPLRYLGGHPKHPFSCVAPGNQTLQNSGSILVLFSDKTHVEELQAGSANKHSAAPPGSAVKVPGVNFVCWTILRKINKSEVKWSRVFRLPIGCSTLRSRARSCVQILVAERLERPIGNRKTLV